MVVICNYILKCDRFETTAFWWVFATIKMPSEFRDMQILTLNVLDTHTHFIYFALHAIPFLSMSVMSHQIHFFSFIWEIKTVFYFIVIIINKPMIIDFNKNSNKMREWNGQGTCISNRFLNTYTHTMAIRWFRYSVSSESHCISEQYQKIK